MTTPASTACGMSPMSGASSSMVSSVIVAVTRPAICVRAPVMRLTAVWDMPPPAGIEPRNAPGDVRQRRWRAIRDWAAAAVRRFATNARPAAAVSAKLMSAMPSAPAHSSLARAEVRDSGPERRQSCRNGADQLDAAALQAEERDRGNRRGNGDQRRWPARPAPSR